MHAVLAEALQGAILCCLCKGMRASMRYRLLREPSRRQTPPPGLSSWRCSFKTVMWTWGSHCLVHNCRAHYEEAGQHEARGELVAESTGGQISSRLLSMRSANALVELPKAAGVLPAGSTVSALLIADLAGMPDSEQLGMTSLPSGQWGW